MMYEQNASRKAVVSCPEVRLAQRQIKSYARMVLAATVLLVLHGCGGGGGDAPQGIAPLPPAVAGPLPPVTPLQVSDSSYKNFKSVGLTPQVLPPGFGVHTTRGYADFSRSGRLDLFTASLTYSPTNPVGQATPSRFEFWLKQSDGSFVKDTTMLASSVGCIHPRKAVVADFNNDGRPDVFVACHGYDAVPFPGERNKIVLSQPGGVYVTQDAAADVGFFHSAAAADLNGDGFFDVVVADAKDPTSVYAFLNNGSGGFQREATGRIPLSVGGKNYFTVELADIDEDGKFDLLLGGHEWEGASTVAFINPGNNNFSAAAPTVLPALAGEGVVLDFTLTGTGAGRTIWILRTSGGDGTFYQSRVVQKVGWPGLVSSTVLNQRPALWIPWLIPALVAGQSVIASDNAGDGVSLPQ